MTIWRPTVPWALSYNQSSTQTQISCKWKSINITTHFIHSRGSSFVEGMCGKKNASSAFRLALIYILSFMSHCAKSMKISEYLLCIDPVGGNWRTSRWWNQENTESFRRDERESQLIRIRFSCVWSREWRHGQAVGRKQRTVSNIREEIPHRKK